MSAYPSLFYKADQRGCEARDHYKCLSTLNYDSYKSPDRVAKGALRYVNDVFLSPGSEITYPANDSLMQILLPVTGTLAYSDVAESCKPVAAEEVLFLKNRKGNYSVQNPYQNGMINYLHIGLNIRSVVNEVTTHPLNFTQYNTPVSLKLDELSGGNFAHAGVYQGRTKGSYELKNSANGVFVYILNGAFEVEERLMENRDGLALWDTKHIAFESLSEFAILLILEIPLN